jgi:hypothetical protein
MTESIHIFNGDFLVEKIKASTIDINTFSVMRECMIEGRLAGNTIEEIFNSRKSFFKNQYRVSEEEYDIKIKFQFDKIKLSNKKTPIYLWFENDLFCQINLWFCIKYLVFSGYENLYRVTPIMKNGDPFTTFDKLNFDELSMSLDNASKLLRADKNVAVNLFNFVQNKNIDYIDMMKVNDSKALPALSISLPILAKYLANPELVIDIIKEYIKDDSKTLMNITEFFSQHYPVYGFGDLQLKNLMDAFKMHYEK